MMYFPLLSLAWLSSPIHAFQMTKPSIISPSIMTRRSGSALFAHDSDKVTQSASAQNLNQNQSQMNAIRSEDQSRRSALSNAAKFLASAVIFNSIALNSDSADAAVGTLPEFSDSNALLQGITIDVADAAQQEAMIAFLEEAFDFKKRRQRKIKDVTDTWMAFGPEQMSIPDDWETGVSSFSKYGGHASIHIRYDSQGTEVYYQTGNEAPGDNIAYLQLGVPTYRISKMVSNGGNILNAYGLVDVVSPSGLPIKAIVGISPDPIMLVALNCQNVKKSREFYEQLGFAEQEYPYCRPNQGQGQFEPPQPKNSVYLAPSKNSMGVLLLQAEKKGKRMKPNPAVRSLNIVYEPPEGTVVDDNADLLKVTDPSAVPITFEPMELFEKQEVRTRIAQPVDA